MIWECPTKIKTIEVAKLMDWALWVEVSFGYHYETKITKLVKIQFKKKHLK